jgi:membrane-associated HD superfamily phosphohydrolase
LFPKGEGTPPVKYEVPMSINGVDVTEQFSLICGSIWLLIYFGIVFFVFKSRPKTKHQRRWKASLLVSGLPVLGIPLLMGIISIVFFLQNNVARNMQPSELLRESLVSLMTSIVCVLPYSAFMSIFAIFGTHSRMKFSDDWLNKIVPPSEDEKPNVHDWL